MNKSNRKDVYYIERLQKLFTDRSVSENRPDNRPGCSPSGKDRLGKVSSARPAQQDRLGLPADRDQVWLVKVEVAGVSGWNRARKRGAYESEDQG